mmetsp:Transcript_79856/g.222353  ORF Transcript_79856/g.222353 Transcript_79856/m.222353 type:complete len:322 (+) Transcript_79856:3122-4087(+)
MAQAAAVVRDARLSLLRIPQVGLRNEDVTHAQHPEATELLRRVEDHGREARGHLGVQTDLDACLHLVLALHEEVQERVSVYHRLTEICHHADKVCVPLVRDLRERGGSRCHEDGAAAVFELLLRLVVDLQKGLRRHLLGGIVLQLPDALSLCEFLLESPDLREDADLEAAEVEEHVRVVFRVHRSEGVVPDECRDAPRQAVLHLPEDGAPQVHVVLHATHAAIARPTHLVVVAHNILVVRVGVLCEEPLDEVSGLLLGEAEHHDESVHVPAVQPDRVTQLGVHVLERQELVRQLGRPRDLRGAREAELQEVKHQAVVLEDE